MRKISMLSGKMFFITIVSISLILVGFWAENSFSSSRLSKKDLTRVNDEGEVSIRVAYLNPLEKANEGELAFEIRMNTHSVDLDGYKMEKLTVLKDDRGNEYKPIGWFKPGGGGHHRFGVVKFSAKDKKGRDIINKDTKYIKIIIKDIDNVKERAFQWNLPL